MTRAERILDKINEIKNLNGKCYIKLTDESIIKVDSSNFEESFIKVASSNFDESTIIHNIIIKCKCYMTLVSIENIKEVY